MNAHPPSPPHPSRRLARGAPQATSIAKAEEWLQILSRELGVSVTGKQWSTGKAWPSAQGAQERRE
jgi:hypothetical protein